MATRKKSLSTTKNKVIQNIKPIISRWQFWRNSAIEPVHGDLSLNIDTVLACVRVLSESVASLPLIVYKKKADQMIPAVNFPLYEMFESCPNPEMTSFDFRHWLMVDCLLHGFGIAQIIRDEVGNAIELWPMRAQEVTAVRFSEPNDEYGITEDDVNKVFYIYHDEILTREEVFRIDAFTFGGLCGMSLVDLASQTLGTALAADKYAGRWFSNADTPSGFVEFNQALTAKQYEDFLTVWKNNYSGKSNQHSVPIIPNGRFNPTPIDHNAAQLLETRQFYRSTIAGVFRVPAHLINDLSHGTYSNVENLDLGFVKHTLRPWASKWEQSIALTILTPTQRKQYCARHNFNDLLRGDQSSRFLAYATGINNGFLSRNEVRAMEDLNPVPGGDEFLINKAQGRFTQDDPANTDNNEPMNDNQIKENV